MRFDQLFFMVCYIGYIGSVFGLCEKVLQPFRVNKRVAALLFFAMELAVNFFSEKLEMPYIIGSTISHLLFIGMVFAASRENCSKKFFVASVFIVTENLVCNFSCSLFSCMMLAAKKLATNGKDVNIGLQGDNWIGGMAYCVVILAICLLGKKMDGVLQNKVKNWYWMLTASLLFIVLIFDIVNWGASNGIMVVSNASGAEYWDIYYNQIFSNIGICLLAALSMCIAAGLVFGGNKIYVEQRQKEQYFSQIAYYKMLQEQYAQMERLRHDMKNHVLSLYGLWDSREYEKAGSYLRKMLERGNIASADEVTGNKAVDALLYYKCRQAKEKNIGWECDVQIPQACVMDEFDLCILFGNILDNALTACGKIEDEEHSFIRIMSKCVKKCLLIVAENTTNMQDIKEMKQGTGLFNIRDTVQKYHGVVKTKVENHCFEISILIPMNQNAYDKEESV